MIKESLRLSFVVAWMSNSLFFTIVHMQDWTKKCRKAKYVIESKTSSMRSLAIGIDISKEQTIDEYSKTISDLCSVYNQFVRELEDLGSRFESLKKCCDLERELLVVRFEGEYGGYESLGKLGEKYGKRRFNGRRPCWESEWGVIERTFHKHL